MRPCDKVLGLPCHQGGICKGGTLWKIWGKNVPLNRVRNCKYINECRKWCLKYREAWVPSEGDALRQMIQMFSATVLFVRRK